MGLFNRNKKEIDRLSKEVQALRWDVIENSKSVKALTEQVGRQNAAMVKLCKNDAQLTNQTQVSLSRVRETLLLVKGAIECVAKIFDDIGAELKTDKPVAPRTDKKLANRERKSTETTESETLNESSVIGSVAEFRFNGSGPRLFFPLDLSILIRGCGKTLIELRMTFKGFTVKLGNEGRLIPARQLKSRGRMVLHCKAFAEACVRKHGSSTYRVVSVEGNRINFEKMP